MFYLKFLVFAKNSTPQLIIILESHIKNVSSRAIDQEGSISINNQNHYRTERCSIIFAPGLQRQFLTF